MASKNKPVLSSIDSYPESFRRDGNNVSRISKDPRPLEVERGHTEYHDSKDGMPCDPPEWAGDRD